jgi:hypothetical protein
MKTLVHAQTNKIGSRCEETVEIDDEDLEGLEGYERELAIDDIAREVMFGLIEWGWEEKKETP